jgi:hypothetical protein
MSVNRKLGVNSAIILKYGDTDQATIKGLNQLTLPALTRSKIKSEEFGVDFAVNDVGGGEHGDISYGGNMVFGDTKGQDQLKQYLKDNEKFTDARVYIDTVTGDFLAADTAHDTEAGFQVINHTPGQATKNGTYPFSGSWAVNGLYAIFTVHREDVASPKLAFVAAGGGNATITDSDSGFVTDGFKAGDCLIIEGSTSNDGTYSIKTVVAGTITLDDGQDLTSEASPGAACILHGGNL